MSFILDITKIATCPSMTIEDNTAYPASPDNHALDYLILYKLNIYNYSTLETIFYSTQSELSPTTLITDSLLTTSGLNIELSLSDGMYSIEGIVLPTPQVGTAYTLEQCLYYNSATYICTTAGTLDNANPLLSTSAIFAVVDEADITDNYRDLIYCANICAVLQEQSVLGEAILNYDINCVEGNLLCANEDATTYYAVFVLIQEIDMESPTLDNLISPAWRDKFLINLSKIQQLHG